MANRKLIVEIVGDSRSVERAFKKSNAAANTFSSKMRKVGVGVAAVLGTAAVVGIGFATHIGIKAVKAASDLGEQINKTNVLFRKGAHAIHEWSLTTASSFGISEEKALEFAGTFGNMLIPMGVARGKAAQMSRGLVQLAADMASFNNVNPEDALLALQSGLAGQVRPLRKLGVFLDQDRIKAEAVSSGIVQMTKDTVKIKGANMDYNDALADHTKTLKKYGLGSKEAAESQYKLEYAQSRLSKAVAGTMPKLTAMQKALATYNIIQRDTRDAHGDFQRTLGLSLPNAIRVLRAQLDDLMGAFGTGLIPVVMRASQKLRLALADPAVRKHVEELGRLIGDKLLKAFVGVSRWFNANWPTIKAGLQTWWNIMKGIVRVVKILAPLIVMITKPLRIQLKILLQIWDKVLGAISTGAGFLSHLPGIGGKFAGIQEAVDAARATLKHPLAGGGGGVNVNGDIHVHGVKDEKDLADKIHRSSKKKSRQTRGRHQSPIHTWR